MIRHTRTAGFAVVLSAAFLSSFVHAAAPEVIVISPTVFDFGWCPDNAKVSAEFTIKNTGTDLIPITSVQPTCGCTASQFSPASLASNEETKVTLTFNTRGYAGTGFNKSAKVKTDSGGAEYQVQLSGFVLNPQAKVVPDQGGIAGFEPGSKEKKKTLTISNKNQTPVTLQVVQKPASWAAYKLGDESVKAGGTTTLEITPSVGFDETRDTSITVEAKEESGSTSRFTVAVRTGTPPSPTRAPSSVMPPPKPAVPLGTTSPEKPGK